MIKSTIITETCKKETFPCLKVATDGTVVLFHSKIKGTVVYITRNNEEDSIGDYSASWNPCNFKPFYGTIEITC